MLTVALKIIAPVVLVAAVATGGVTFARAAANTFTGGFTDKAGDGTSAASGFIVASPVYTLDSADPTKVSKVVFDLDATPPAGSKVKIHLDSTKAVTLLSSWYDCTFSGATVTCDMPSASVTQTAVVDVNELRVIVAQ